MSLPVYYSPYTSEMLHRGVYAVKPQTCRANSQTVKVLLVEFVVELSQKL